MEQIDELKAEAGGDGAGGGGGSDGDGDLGSARREEDMEKIESLRESLKESSD